MKKGDQWLSVPVAVKLDHLHVMFPQEFYDFLISWKEEFLEGSRRNKRSSFMGELFIKDEGVNLNFR